MTVAGKRIGRMWLFTVMAVIAGLFLMLFFTPHSVNADTNASVKGVMNSDNTVCSITVSGFTMPSGGQTLKAAVWSAKDGQDDVRWYDMKKSGSSYTCSVKISDHGAAGTYYVHCYYVTAGGQMAFAVNGEFLVKGMSCSAITVSNVNQQAGTCRVTVSGISSAYGLSRILIPTWHASDQSDILWYEARRDASGNYYADVSIANHQNHTGKYFIHVYGYDAPGTAYFLGSTETEFTGGGQSAKTLSASLNSSEKQGTITLSGYTMPSDGAAYTAAVWTEKNDQDDIKWYDLKKNSSGDYKYIFPVTEHADGGKAFVHVYLRTKSNTMRFIGNTSYEVTLPTCRTIAVADADPSAGTWKVNVSGITSRSGVTKVQVPVWCASDQSDIRWYQAEKNSDGSWTANVDVNNHSRHTGSYKIHVYITCGNGITAYAGSSSYNYQQGAPKVSVSVSDTNVTMRAENVTNPGGVAGVRFAIWSKENGQDDLKWINGVYTAGSASAQAVTSLLEHSGFGDYHVHVYGTDRAGKSFFIGNTDFTVKKPAAKRVRAETIKGSGEFEIRITGITSDTGIETVKIPVWSAADQSDIVWYEALPDKNGTIVLNSDVAAHRGLLGKYYVHVYIRDRRGDETMAGSTSFEVKSAVGSVSVTPDESGLVYHVSLPDVRISDAFTGLGFAVWSIAGSQDDLVWYKAAQSAAGEWSADVLWQNHHTTGEYALHIYAYMADGSMQLLKVSSFEVSAPLMDTLSFSNRVDGGITASVIPSAAPAQIRKMYFAVWQSSDQSDILWYTGVLQDNGSYSADISYVNHQYHTGNYKVHVYYADPNGNMQYVCGDEVRITSSADTGDFSCLIVGGDTVRVYAPTGRTDAREYGLFVLDPGTDSIFRSAVPVATASGDTDVVLTAPLNLHTAASLLQCRFAIGVKSGNYYVQDSGTFYITNPEAVAQYTHAFPETRTKKGLQVQYTMLDDAAELGVNHAVMGIALPQLTSERTFAYTYNGEKYYFSKSFIASLDQLFRQLYRNGSVTTCVLLMPWSSSDQDLILPSGREAGHPFYALNTEEKAGRKKLEAIFTFLAERYTSYNVVNWILSNEVSYGDYYYYCGDVSDEQYVKYYTDGFRLLYNSVKSVYSNARAYVCQDHVWTYKRSYAMTGKALLTNFVKQLASEGEVMWHLAFHPYPVPLTDANFWSTSSTAVINSANSPMFTMKNLTYLTNYIRNTYGAEHRVILSESGFTSVSKGEVDETTQAAAICYGYYLAETNDMVDSFVVHRHVDHTEEMVQGLYLGLWNNDGNYGDAPSTKKLSWTVYKYMDTPSYLQYTNFALSFIGASSWSELVPGFNTIQF